MQWGTYLLAFFPPGAAESVAPISGTEIIQVIIGAFNLGTLGWVCWVFFNNKLHSDGEMERVRAVLAGAAENARADLARTVETTRTELARVEETTRTELARAVEAARTDLLRENEQLRTEKAKAEEQRDAAMNIAQERLVPLLVSFVATSQSLLPLLQELVRRREV